MSRARPPFRVILAAHLRADARKAAVLIVLAVVMVVIYARLFMKEAVVSEASASVSATLPGPVPLPVAPSAAPVQRERLVLAEAPVRNLDHDPFAVDLDKYPAARFVEDDPKAVVSGHADDAVRKDAESLVLQAAVSGRRPMACINGQFLRPGQQVNGFVLRRVESTRVILQRDGVQVILLLK